MTYIITLLKVSENFNTIYLYSSLWLYFKHYELQALDSRKLKKKKKGSTHIVTEFSQNPFTDSLFQKMTNWHLNDPNSYKMYFFSLSQTHY